MGESGGQEQPKLTHEEWLKIDYVKQLTVLTGGKETPELLILAEKLTAEKLKFEMQAIRDPLTKAFNRRYLDSTLEWELKASPFLNRNLGLMFVDIDHFKDVNDNEPRGHKAGDEALQVLVKKIDGVEIDNGFVARFGGEEFLRVLLDTDKERLMTAAQKLAQDVRQNLAREAHLTREKVTVSMGLVIAKEGETADELISRGDKLMYEAKEGGRSRICMEGADGQTVTTVIE